LCKRFSFVVSHFNRLRTNEQEFWAFSHRLLELETFVEEGSPPNAQSEDLFCKAVPFDKLRANGINSFLPGWAFPVRGESASGRSNHQPITKYVI
jgi:hypothetical protein